GPADENENRAIGKIEEALNQQRFQISLNDNLDDKRKLIRLFRNLNDSVDALSDLLTSESVHQMVQGNAMRSGATLEAVAAGEVTAPEMEIAKTPRTGIANTYRVASIFPENEAINNTSW